MTTLDFEAGVREPATDDVRAITIDLARIVQERSRDIISGRPTGRSARDMYGLVSPVGKDESIEVLVPEHIRVVTPSFFMGLLSIAVSEMNSLSDALSRITLINASDTTHLNLDHALRTLLATGSPFEGLKKQRRRFYSQLPRANRAAG